MQLKSLHDGFTLQAYHSPAKGARKGGVVVIQEIFGVTEHVRTMSDRFAAEGYEVIAPALFDRIEPGFERHPPDQAAVQKGRDYIQKTPWDQVAGDVQAAVNALKPGPVFVTGFCWGGTVSWLAAARCHGLNAASAYYGRMIVDLLGEKPQVPIILHFGEKDPSIDASLRNQITSAYPSIPSYLYDAGHGFCRAGSQDYNPAACDLAFQRTLDLFAANGG